jgi:hypothetical protein
VDTALPQVERDRGRDQRELVGFPVANLEVEGAACAPRSGDEERHDHVAGRQRRLDVGRSAGAAMQVGERDAAVAPGADDVDHRVERDQRLGEIPGIGGDAMIARAEHGMHAVVSVHGGAAAARVALVALGIGDIAEIGAAGALEDVAGEACHIADLRACGERERLCDHRIVAANLRVVGGLRHAHQAAEPETAPIRFDAAHGPGRQRIDVDDLGWPHHVELHQVDQRRATGEQEALARSPGCGREGPGFGRRGRRARLLIDE